MLNIKHLLALPLTSHFCLIIGDANMMALLRAHGQRNPASCLSPPAWVRDSPRLFQQRSRSLLRPYADLLQGGTWRQDSAYGPEFRKGVVLRTHCAALQGHNGRKSRRRKWCDVPFLLHPPGIMKSDLWHLVGANPDSIVSFWQKYLQWQSLSACPVPLYMYVSYSGKWRLLLIWKYTHDGSVYSEMLFFWVRLHFNITYFWIHSFFSSRFL